MARGSSHRRLTGKQRGQARAQFMAVDFFCGAGGTARGLIDAGGYLIAGVDHDWRFETTFTKNNRNLFLDRRHPQFLNYNLFPQGPKHPTGQQMHLMEVLDGLLTEFKNRYPELPMLFSICAPCQPFTRLSHRPMTSERKIARKRDSSLLSESLAFVREFRPELIFSENVSGISGSKHGGVWQAFQVELEDLGYVTGTNVVCASNFGIPQYRRRSILLGIRMHRHTKPIPRNRQALVDSIYVPTSDSESPTLSVREAIGHYPPLVAGESNPEIPNHSANNLSPTNRKRLRVAKPGGSNKVFLNSRYGDLSLGCHRRAFKRTGKNCFPNTYTRMHPDLPAPTITTRCTSISNGRFGHYDRNQTRAISLREAARLQSFPDNYTFFPLDHTGIVAKMIGNAVPPKLAEFFAKYISTLYWKSQNA